MLVAIFYLIESISILAAESCPLAERRDTGLHRNLTVIAVRTSFGKTSLVATK